MKTNNQIIQNQFRKPIIFIVVFCFGMLFLLNGQTLHIPANDPNIAFRGLMYAVKSADSVVLNRFSPGFWKIAAANFDSVKGKTQSGVVISFKTASPSVTVNFKNRALSQLNPAYWGIYKNGIFQGYKTSFPIVLSSGTTQPTTWEIVLPILHGVNFTGLDVQTGYTTLPLDLESKKQYIAIGNSITHGVGQINASSDSTYAFLLAKNMGWRLYNLAVAGSTITPLIADQTNPAITNVTADVISVLWGYNNWNLNQNMTTVSSSYQSLLTKLRSYHPNANIYCIMPTFTTSTTAGYGTTPRYTSFDTLRNSERRVVNNLIAGGDKKMFIIEGGDLTKSSDLYDVVHLTANGAASFAQNLTTLIQQIELTTGLKNLKVNNSIKLFPNPVKANILNITITDLQQPNNITITDLTGNVVYTKKLQNIENQSISLSGLNLKGLYIAQIGSKSFNYSHLLEIY